MLLEQQVWSFKQFSFPTFVNHSLIFLEYSSLLLSPLIWQWICVSWSPLYCHSVYATNVCYATDVYATNGRYIGYIAISAIPPFVLLCLEKVKLSCCSSLSILFIVSFTVVYKYKHSTCSWMNLAQLSEPGSYFYFLNKKLNENMLSHLSEHGSYF